MLNFIYSSPSPFHAVALFAGQLEANGFEKLEETQTWNIQAGGKYFVTRNDSSIIAFTVPAGKAKRFHIIASHSDSPSFKIKENPEMNAAGCVKLNVEKYGGMLCAPWFDRPLSVAGRIIFRNAEGKLEQKLVMVDRDLLMIPNLAIHMNREANDGYKFNAQKDLLPVLCTAAGAGSGAGSKGADKTAASVLLNIVAESAGVDADAILGHDLFLYNRQEGTFWGASEEFIASPKLDDLECAYASMQGLVAASRGNTACADTINVVAVFDNEEVGSGTKQGADSTFLEDTFERVAECLEMKRSELLAAYAGSFMISADNAHAVHPNYAEKADPVNQPKINGGPVIKYNAAQHYCTDGVSSAVLKDLCSKAGIPFQTFTNRSDVAGGSTLGNISLSHVSMNAVDIGLPQWAMHSPYESAGTADVLMLKTLSETFFRS
ncbi:MAG: M18 family aminopeptidase [Treponemataceae bacterium]|nr:M18 family aminopeptidase [Treponemataceae bacterium]